MTVLSLGLLFPYAFYKHKKYQFENLHVGQLPLALHATAGVYYAAILIPIFLAVALGLLITFLSFFMLVSVAVVPLVMLYVLTLFLLIPLIQGSLYRVTWSKVSIGNSTFTCDLSEWRYAWIVVSNWLARVFSLGLLTPWAAIRLHKYKIESLSIVWQDDPNYILSIAQQDHPAFAEEMSDILDIDVSL